MNFRAWGDVGNKGNFCNFRTKRTSSVKIRYFYHSKDSQVQNTQNRRVDDFYYLLPKRQNFLVLSHWFLGIIHFRNLFANERFWCLNVAFTSLSSSCSATQSGKGPFYIWKNSCAKWSSGARFKVLLFD